MPKNTTGCTREFEFCFADAVPPISVQKLVYSGASSSLPTMQIYQQLQRLWKKPYVIIEKAVGETPLAALETYRSTHLELRGIPLSYAGRLDPMASGKLLILIGDECKVQEKYHALDKEYVFTVLFGASSDTGDVLGRIVAEEHAPNISEADIRRVLPNFLATITLPYPHFSSKTVQGKPLHLWTLEGRLNEIEIPTYTGTIKKIALEKIEQKKGSEIAEEILSKIETIPRVDEASKALGRDFRRDDVRADWHDFKNVHGDDTYTLATFRCRVSSGVYMRTLSELIAKELGTRGLAYHIHRSKMYL